MQPFVHLHVHSQYSLLDGQASITRLVDKAREDGQEAIAITDHGAMFGIKEFTNYVAKINAPIENEIQKLKKNLDNTWGEELTSVQEKIRTEEAKLFKPIIGCEVYVAQRDRHQKTDKEDARGHHLIVLAKNLQGYKNLIKMVSKSWTEGYYFVPRVDKELLELHREGLIITSGCLGGEVAKKIGDNQPAEAEEVVQWFKKLFGDDYYLEMQRHKTHRIDADQTVYPKQMEINAELVRLSQKYGIKIIASNDVHFVNEEDADAHDRLICLSTGKDFDDPNRMRYSKQEWLKTTAEMNAVFADMPEALANTLEIADKIEFYSINNDALMPFYPIDPAFGTEEGYRQKYNETALIEEFGEEDFNRLGGFEKVIRIKLESDYLAYLTEIGAKKRYGEEYSTEVKERLEFELETMKKMGYPGYFLIVQDFIAAAREMDVSVGPGRGSAAGSAVAYCLGITDIDPLKYDLLFERFLNPDRISMPDIDIDFDDEGRGKVLRYVTEKYGSEKVAHIVTYGTMAAKSSIKDVARVHKLPLPESDRLAKLIPDRIPNVKKINIQAAIDHVPELQVAIKNDPLVKETLKYAQMLEGNVRNTGVHACGVIIGQTDISDIVPISTAEVKETREKVLVTQFDGNSIEETGLIKMDFLGLKTLSIIKDAVANIQLTTGKKINIDTIPIDDAKTYQLYSDAKTVGTFQFESSGMREYLRELKPTQFEDLIAMNALYRPGPMQYIPSFIKRKNGKETISYDLPVMEKRLKETYGITVYQEQVMLLSRDIANFTRGQSDELRKAMGKKIIEKMDDLKGKFISGGKTNGHDERTLHKIWADWEKFAEYAFNKSHSACYSWIAYQTAWLKANYPSEYMASVLSNNLSSITEVSKCMDECKSMNIKVLSPDVNESHLKFSVNKAGDVRFGLGAIKNVGEGAVLNIIDERTKNGAFKDVFDFVERINLTSCNKKTIEALALSGAFDSLPGISREQFFATNNKGEEFIDTLIRYGNKFQLDKQTAQNSLFGDDISFTIAHPEIPTCEKWSDLARLHRERELIGIFLSAHPLDDYEFILKHVCNADATTLQNISLFNGKLLTFGGMVVSVREGQSKTGNPYAILKMEDYAGSYEIPLFGKDYIDYGKYSRQGFALFFKGKVQPKQWRPDADELEIKIISISLLSEVKDNLVEKVCLQLPISDLNDAMVNEISTILRNNPGKAELYFKIQGEQHSIHLFSRQTKVQVNKKFIDALKEQGIEFSLN